MWVCQLLPVKCPKNPTFPPVTLKEINQKVEVLLQKMPSRNIKLFFFCLLLRCSLLRAAGHVVRAAARLPDLCVVHEGHPRLHGGGPAGGQSVRLVPQPDAAHRWRGMAAGASP